MNPAVFDGALGALPETFRESKPVVAAVLGSGWNGVLASAKTKAEVAYADIPGMGAATVVGHAGRLVLAALPDGAEALLFCGRRHWYEGAAWEAVVMPAVLAHRLGCRAVVLTNAAGGISPSLHPGSVVALRDHLRLSALSPLQGPHHDAFGPRFPDQSRVYDDALRRLAVQAGAKCGIEMQEGVYAFSGGPAFETPAEVKALGMLGADVVGMSTVPEAMVASAIGLRVVGLSFVSNWAAGISETPLDGKDVVACAEKCAGTLSSILFDTLRAVAAECAGAEGSRS